MSERTDKCVALFEELGIPFDDHRLVLNKELPSYLQDKGKYHRSSSISLDIIYVILTDIPRMKVIMAKIKMKAFL